MIFINVLGPIFFADNECVLQIQEQPEWIAPVVSRFQVAI
jgi:hypothetical protein